MRNIRAQEKPSPMKNSLELSGIDPGKGDHRKLERRSQGGQLPKQEKAGEAKKQRKTRLGEVARRR